MAELGVPPGGAASTPPKPPMILPLLNIKGGLPVLNFGPKSGEALTTMLTPVSPLQLTGKKMGGGLNINVPTGLKWGYDGPVNPTSIPQATQMDSSGIGGGSDSTPQGRGR